MGKHGTNYDDMHMPRCERCGDTGAVLDTDGPPFDIHTGERKMKRCPDCNPKTDG